MRVGLSARAIRRRGGFLEHESEDRLRADEQRRMRRLRLLVDIATVAVRSHPLSRTEAEQVVDTLRAHALRLFPDKADTFDLIYGRRFRRLIDERFGPE